VSQEFAKIPVDILTTEHRNVWAGSAEEHLRPMDGTGVTELTIAEAKRRLALSLGVNEEDIKITISS
jgi:hypothetical protein